MTAAHAGHTTVASLLLDHGANINASRGFDHWQPIHLAASRGHQAVVELLLARGADIKARGDKCL